MCLLQPLHTGSEILEDILKPALLGIYTFLEIHALLWTNLLISPPNNACIVSVSYTHLTLPTKA